MTDKKCKYHINDNNARKYLINEFDAAIKLCKYQNIYKAKLTEEDALSSYVFYDGTDIFSTIDLVKDNEFFYVVITTPFYVHMIKLLDVNRVILAYLIRNSTRSIDDYDDCYMFFKSFFNEHFELKDRESLMPILNQSVDEAVEIIHFYEVQDKILNEA